MTPNLLPTLVQLLAAQPEVARVVLFGSRARGDAGPRSDVDLAIDAPGATSRQWLDWETLIEDAETLIRIDVIRWHEASPALRERIAREGQVLFERSQAPRQPEQPRERAPAPA